MLTKLFKKTYNKWYGEGHKQGLQEGMIKYSDTYGKYYDFINNVWFDTQKELNELREFKTKIEETIEKNASQKSSTLDDNMLYFKSITEIINTKFFNTTLYENINSKAIKGILEYVDYLEHTFEIKATYPETYYHLPELKKAFTNIYNNKLIVEEAERSIKG